VKGSIILCSSAMRRIQRSGLTDIPASSMCLQKVSATRDAKRKVSVD
jgi:hypothetical protein